MSGASGQWMCSTVFDMSGASSQLISNSVAFDWLVRITASHPEHAELGLRDPRVERRREAERQHAARLRRRDDAVVPEPCGRIIRIALGLELIADRLLELRLLLGRPGL